MIDGEPSTDGGPAVAVMLVLAAFVVVAFVVGLLIGGLF